MPGTESNPYKEIIEQIFDDTSCYSQMDENMVLEYPDITEGGDYQMHIVANYLATLKRRKPEMFQRVFQTMIDNLTLEKLNKKLEIENQRLKFHIGKLQNDRKVIELSINKNKRKVIDKIESAFEKNRISIEDRIEICKRRKLELENN